MPATPARIGFIQRDVRVVVAESTTAQARYGSDARRDEQPVRADFDTIAHGQLVADERIGLFGEARRRFQHSVADLETGVLLLEQMQAYAVSQDPADRPVVRYVDEVRGIDALFLVTSVELDFANQSSTLEIWG